jgi:decaprenylphospho-beta-D-erythro-pentofuranosid-2-ulose 2-reductase
LESNNKTILILGGNSDIGKALAVAYAKQGYNLYLTSRNSEDTLSLSKDLKIRFDIEVNCFELDVLDFDSHSSFYQKLEIKPLGAISSVGYLDEQLKSQSNWDECLRSIQTNFTGLVSILNIIAEDFEKRQSGFIIGISSVAGERGRQSNYIYGSSKAAYTAYLDGLRNRLHRSDVQVLTVKPGFVSTKMTHHLNLPKPLTAKPEKIAQDILKAQKNKKNTLYTLWFWKWIMVIIKNIPEIVFKKLKL